MKSIIIFFSLLVGLTAYADLPPQEDLLDKKYWSTLDEKAKPAFLMGFRYGGGCQTIDIFMNTDQFQERLKHLNTHTVPGVVSAIDAFYKAEDNAHVYLRSAIEAGLMQIIGNPKMEIEKFTNKAREVQEKRAWK